MAKQTKTKRKSVSEAAQPQPSNRMTEPATRSPWAWSVPVSVAIGLVVLLLAILVLRWHLLDLPLERDESAYAYIGKNILDGKLPYRDIYEMKPPLLLYSYAALVAIFGYSLSGLHWAALVMTFWNAAWVMAIGGRFFGRFYGFAAGLCYVFLTANPFTCALIAESELIVMGFVLPGLYCLLRWESAQVDENSGNEHSSPWWLFSGGFLLACGVMVKQTGVFFFGAAALLLFLVFWAKQPRRLSFLIRSGTWLAAGALVPVASCLLLVYSLGVWEDFWFWNIKYMQTYASGLNRDLWTTAFEFNISLLTKNFVWYWFLGGLGFLMLLTSALTGRSRLLLLGLLLCAVAAVTPGWRFYGHYWLQFLPVLALFMAALFYHFERGLARAIPKLNLRPAMAVLLSVALLVPVLQYAPTLFKGDVQRLIRSMFPGNPYAEDQVLAGVIAAKLQPEDRIAVLGSEPQYYIYLNREAPSKHFYMAFSMRPIPESEAWQQETLDSILSQKPRFIVFNFVEYSWMPKKDSKMLLYEGSYRFARQNYRPIAWADMVRLSETKFILNEEAARQYTPTGQRYVTVYEWAGPPEPAATPPSQ